MTVDPSPHTANALTASQMSSNAFPMPQEQGSAHERTADIVRRADFDVGFTMSHFQIIAKHNGPGMWQLFVVLFLVLFGFVTWTALQSGETGTRPYIFAGVWVMGLGVLVHALTLPRTRIETAPGVILVREIYLWKTVTHRFAAEGRAPELVISEHSNDGTPYFLLHLVTPTGRRIAVGQKGKRSEAAEQKRALMQLWS